MACSFLFFSGELMVVDSVMNHVRLIVMMAITIYNLARQAKKA